MTRPVNSKVVIKFKYNLSTRPTAIFCGRPALLTIQCPIWYDTVTLSYSLFEAVFSICIWSLHLIRNNTSWLKDDSHIFWSENKRVYWDNHYVWNTIAEYKELTSWGIFQMRWSHAAISFYFREYKLNSFLGNSQDTFILLLTCSGCSDHQSNIKWNTMFKRLQTCRKKYNFSRPFIIIF